MRPSLKDQASLNANKWAQQRKDQMEIVKQRQNSRERTNFAAMGDMMIGNRAGSAQKSDAPRRQIGSIERQQQQQQKPGIKTQYEFNQISSSKQVQQVQEYQVNNQRQNQYQQQQQFKQQQYQQQQLQQQQQQQQSYKQQSYQQKQDRIDPNPQNQLRLLKEKMNNGQTNSRQGSRGDLQDNVYVNNNQAQTNSNYRQQFIPSNQWEEIPIKGQKSNQESFNPPQQIKRQQHNNMKFDEFSDDIISTQSSQKKPPIMKKSLENNKQKPEQRVNQNKVNNNGNNIRQQANKKEIIETINTQSYNYYNPHDEAPAIATGNQNIPVDPYEEVDEYDLQECQGCGRKFNPVSLKKHQKICQKVFQTKRKEFNAKEHRIIDDQHAQLLRNQEQLEKQKQKQQQQQQNKKPIKQDDRPIQGQKQAKWQAQSEAFRAIIAQSKGKQLTKEQTAQIKQAQQIDMIQCQFCGRNFNETAGKRHVPFCEEKSRKDKFKSGPQQQMQKTSTQNIQKRQR